MAISAVSATIAAVGLAVSLYGTYEKNKGANQQLTYQKQMIGVEQEEEALRKQIMELTAEREQRQNLRNVQRARALALASASSQGAQFGSALGGGLGQISGQGGQNTRNIEQDLMAGEQMFGLQSRMSGLKMKYADAGGLVNFGSGLQSIGSAIGSSQKELANLSYYAGGKIGSMVASPFASPGYYGDQYQGEPYG